VLLLPLAQVLLLLGEIADVEEVVLLVAAQVERRGLDLPRGVGADHVDAEDVIGQLGDRLHAPVADPGGGDDQHHQRGEGQPHSFP
jgi:hypothetical protein